MNQDAESVAVVRVNKNARIEKKRFIDIRHTNIPVNDLEVSNQELSMSIEIERNTRFSKYLANNINDFTIYSNESLAIDLAAFLMEHCQKNTPDVFGFYQYHYDVFCNILSYSPENLFRHYLLADSNSFLKGEEVELSKVPFIVRKEKESINLDELFDKSQKGDRAFSTCILGNLFYEFRYKNFVGLDRKAIFKDKNGSIVELHGADFNLIEEYHVIYNRNRRDKTIIFFKPNRDLLFNNFKYFLFIDLNKFKELTLNKKKLFIFLSSKINELKLKGQNVFKMPVNEGCKISSINLSEAKQNKKKLKLFLSDVNELLDTGNKFKLKEEKLTLDSKHNYLLSLEFSELKPFDKKDIEAINKSRYSDYYRKALYENYVKYHYTIENGSAIKLSFEDWLNDSTDIEHKITAYIESQAVIYNKKLNRDNYEVLKEFTPNITLSLTDAKTKLLNDPLLKQVETLYNFKVRNEIKEILSNQINEDKFLNHSIEMFLKAHTAYKAVVYAKDKDTFCVVLKDKNALNE